MILGGICYLKNEFWDSVINFFHEQIKLILRVKLAQFNIKKLQKPEGFLILVILLSLKRIAGRINMNFSTNKIQYLKITERNNLI